MPRYVSLKFDKVNARAGPGDDHRLLWVYRVRGLPLQVVAETAEWRRVCDPDGELAWVHKRTTDGRRMALNAHRGRRAMRRGRRRSPEPSPISSPRARPRWTAATAAGAGCGPTAPSGWVPAGELWGTAEAVQCRAQPSAARLGR